MLDGQDVLEDEQTSKGVGANGTKQADPLSSWYGSQTFATATREETIGLLGRRSGDAGGDGLGRKSRYARIIEILSIVRTFDIVHGVTPRTLRKMLEELGPTFVKAGQILSMRSEILPESFCHELAKLRSEVEPMPHEVMLQTLRKEYDRPLEEIFESIDNVPLGSASVAQVHKARLVTGEMVAVKVQRPGIRAIMAQDINIMRSIARHANRVMGDEQFLDIKSVVEELWQSFREETDFLVEARSLEEFRRNNAKSACVTCPKPFPGLCTSHVVVMDYVEGIPISKLNELSDAGYDVTEIGEKLVDNYARQMIDDGFFHADPHPGNIVIAGSKIVYLDLGMMGRLSARDRQAFSEMVFAVADRDTPRLKAGLLQFAVATDQSQLDHARLLADLDSILRDYGTTSLSDLDLAKLLSTLITVARRDGIELPGSITMLARSLVTLEGTVAHMLDDLSIVDVIAMHVRSDQSMWDLGRREAQDLSRESRLAVHGLLKAASEASLAMSMLTRGQLRMNMDMGGSEDPIADFSHAFDRLTMGIVIAGLFIGSSIIYYSGIKPLLFGVPVLGFVGFCVAFVLGVRLVLDIMREGKRRR